MWLIPSLTLAPKTISVPLLLKLICKGSMWRCCWCVQTQPELAFQGFICLVFKIELLSFLLLVWCWKLCKHDLIWSDATIYDRRVSGVGEHLMTPPRSPLDGPFHTRKSDTVTCSIYMGVTRVSLFPHVTAGQENLFGERWKCCWLWWNLDQIAVVVVQSWFYRAIIAVSIKRRGRQPWFWLPVPVFFHYLLTLQSRSSCTTDSWFDSLALKQQVYLTVSNTKDTCSFGFDCSLLQEFTPDTATLVLVFFPRKLSWLLVRG